MLLFHLYFNREYSHERIFRSGYFPWKYSVEQLLQNMLKIFGQEFFCFMCIMTDKIWWEIFWPERSFVKHFCRTFLHMFGNFYLQKIKKMKIYRYFQFSAKFHQNHPKICIFCQKMLFALYFLGNRQTDVKLKKIETLREIDAFSYPKHYYSAKIDKTMVN